MNNNNSTLATIAACKQLQHQQIDQEDQNIFPSNAIEQHTNAISSMLDSLAAIPTRSIIQQLPTDLSQSLDTYDLKFDQGAQMLSSHNITQVLQQEDDSQQSKTGDDRFRYLIQDSSISTSANSKNIDGRQFQKLNSQSKSATQKFLNKKPINIPALKLNLVNNMNAACNKIRPVIPKPSSSSSSSSGHRDKYNNKLSGKSVTDHQLTNTLSSRRKLSQSSRQNSTIGQLSRNYDQVPLGISQSLLHSQNSYCSNRGAITSCRSLNQNKKQQKKKKSVSSQNYSKSPIVSAKSSWLLEAENYVLDQNQMKYGDYDDYDDDLSLTNMQDFMIRTNQSLQSNEAGGKIEDQQSVCIITIPKNKLQQLNNKYLAKVLDVNKKTSRQGSCQMQQKTSDSIQKKVPTLNLDLSACLNKKKQGQNKKSLQNIKLMQHIETTQFSPINSSNASTPSRRMNQTQTLDFITNTKQQSAFKAAKDDLKEKSTQKKKKLKANPNPLYKASTFKEKTTSQSESPDKKSRNCTARSNTSRITNKSSNSRKICPNPTQLLTGLNPPNSQFDLTPLLKHRKKSPSTIIFQSNYTTTSSSLAAPRSLSSMSQSAIPVQSSTSTTTLSSNNYANKRKPANQGIKSPNNNSKRVLSSSFGNNPMRNSSTTLSSSTNNTSTKQKTNKSERKAINQESIGKRKSQISFNKIQQQQQQHTKSPQFQMKKIQIKQKASPTSSQSSCSLYHQANNKKYHLQDQIKQATEKQEDSNTYRFSRNYYQSKKSS